MLYYIAAFAAIIATATGSPVTAVDPKVAAAVKAQLKNMKGRLANNTHLQAKVKAAPKARRKLTVDDDDSAGGDSASSSDDYDCRTPTKPPPPLARCPARHQPFQPAAQRTPPAAQSARW
jgi:hypothetical protein